MEMRGCRNLHFIAAIKNGLVTKLRNMSSCGKPALRFKSLKDVFDSEDAKRICSDYAVDVEDNKVKTEGSARSCLPLADRTLWKGDFGSFEFVSNDYDDDDDDMSDDSSIPLSQLKEIRKRKKQKLSYGDFQFEEDEFDLKEPLVHWKKKLVKKTLKRKRKCSSKRDIRFELALVDMSEPMVASESFDYADGDLMSLVCVKREYPEESFDFPSPIAFIDVEEPKYDTKIPDEVLEGGNEYKNQELVLYGDRYQEYYPDSPEDIQIDGCDSFQQVLCIEECRNCALDEDPVPLLEISDSNIDYVNDEMMSCQPHEVQSIPVSGTNNKSDTMFHGSPREFVMLQKDQICHVSETSNDSHVLNGTSGQSSASSGVKSLGIAVNSTTETINSLPPVTQSECLPFQQSVSSLCSNTYSSLDDEYVSTNDRTVEGDQSRACSSTDSSKDCWSPRDNFPSMLPKTSGKEPHETASADSKSGSSSRTPTFLDDYALSALVLQNPGRFTRKIIPPTSQERICLALNSEELHNGADEYKCMEKLFLEEKTRTIPSIGRSNIETAKGDENTAQSEKLNRRKVVITPSQIFQKEKNVKRGSTLKGNLEQLEQPSYSRSLPCINTGCTSVTSCSKGAIAFSQRQMHDIDSLAGKLLNELKFMKDIVEQKLLLNSSRNLTLRNEADEVVEAIKTATRVEQNAKRLLSVMSRDCNRYCKIMSLTRDGHSLSPREDEIHREKRKIVFADEAGEMLCHIKFFENGSSFQPLAPKQDNQNC